MSAAAKAAADLLAKRRALLLRALPAQAQDLSPALRGLLLSMEREGTIVYRESYWHEAPKH